MTRERRRMSGEAEMRAVADGDWTETAEPTRWEFYIRPDDEQASKLIATFRPVGWRYASDDVWCFSEDEPTHIENRQQVYTMEVPD